ncbi:hypothetical protein ACTHO0_25545 [Cytobacillus praedii]|uniref:hypothetical protein n=1 Tax=Cytobacillus praedii TaxID=1742358 RepID=UPI003F81D3DF
MSREDRRAFIMWVRELDSSEFIRLYHTEEDYIEDELRASYCADELLCCGYNW